MVESASSLLAPWSSFYVMTGSAAAGLTGLMFVVITLITDNERLRNAPDGLGTFSTPTVVHFGAALFVSATLSAPWHGLLGPGIVLGLAGLCGVGYAIRLFYRTRRVTGYSPDLEDWIWYTILPFIAYGAILAGAIMFATVPAEGLFALAAGVAFLIFIGIHNAWDIVTYLVISGKDQPPKSR
jgi:hypothetical protein